MTEKKKTRNFAGDGNRKMCMDFWKAEVTKVEIAYMRLKASYSRHVTAFEP